MAKGIPIGRPPGSSTLLTPEVTKRICDRLEIAVPEHYAAEEQGISRGLFWRWMRLGEAGQEPYAAFFDAVTRARAKCFANLHAKALRGEKGSSQATWLLERRFWREYAEHKRVEIAPDTPMLSESELDEAIAEQRQIVSEYERVRAMLPKPKSIESE